MFGGSRVIQYEPMSDDVKKAYDAALANKRQNRQEELYMAKYINPFYKTKKWLRKREVIFRRDDYECKQTKRYGPSKLAETVHHIYPLSEYPELALVNWNLISLTHKQHGRMHDRTNNSITALGKEWQERVRPQFEEYYRLKEEKENV